MNVMRTTKPSFNRRALATQAMQAAAATRARAKLDQVGPICIYGLCETLGVAVRFSNINMEGMYQRGLPPRIHLSARRPLPRRAYNCAHELGHHVFGHGSSIDELREDAKAQPWEGDYLPVDKFPQAWQYAPTLLPQGEMLWHGNRNQSRK